MNIGNENKRLKEINSYFLQTYFSKDSIQAVEKNFSAYAMAFPEYGYPLIGKPAILEHLNQIKFPSIDIVTHIDRITQSSSFALFSGSIKRNLKSQVHFLIIWKKGNNDWKIYFSRGLIPGKNLVNHNHSLKKLSKTSLSDIEHIFMQKAKKTSIAEAFYTFIDESGFALGHQDKQLTKHDYHLMLQGEKKKESEQLEWKVIYSYLDDGQEFGFNMGPWYYINEDYTQYGYFLTIWKKQRDGNWKFVFDGGIDSPPNELSK